MGYMAHDYILITHPNRELINWLHEEICKIWKEYFDISTISPVIESCINGYFSIIVGPDGSKESWEESDKGDAARGRIMALLEKEEICYLLVRSEEDGTVSFRSYEPCECD